LRNVAVETKEQVSGGSVRSVLYNDAVSCLRFIRRQWYVNGWGWSIGGMILTGESQSSRRETCLSCRVVESTADVCVCVVCVCVCVCTFSPLYTRISWVSQEPELLIFSSYPSSAVHTSTLRKKFVISSTGYIYKFHGLLKMNSNYFPKQL